MYLLGAETIMQSFVFGITAAAISYRGSAYQGILLALELIGANP
jgi:hypothetical protein